MWRQDQAGQVCAFTAAAAVNNRSLFPCQEPPVAMASWQCVIETNPQDLTVLCTGDEDGILMEKGHYFYTQMILPMSTFAVAIGKWSAIDLVLPTPNNPKIGVCKKLHEPYPCHIMKGDQGPLIPCKLYGPEFLVKLAKKLWKIYLQASLESAYELLGNKMDPEHRDFTLKYLACILGQHPFQKLDIVIVPRCYSGLGLASPSLMFVSQSLVLGNEDAGMLIRISHEISHNWFGLLIGAKDWTEEWLTEVLFIIFQAGKTLALRDRYS